MINSIVSIKEEVSFPSAKLALDEKMKELISKITNTYKKQSSLFFTPEYKAYKEALRKMRDLYLEAYLSGGVSNELIKELIEAENSHKELIELISKKWNEINS